MRRFGDPVQPGKRYIMRPGAYAVLRRGSHVLVTHQMDPDPEYQLPGGGVDPGESPIRALHREVMEETGWHIDTPRRLGAYRRFAYMPEYDRWSEKVCAVYLARPTIQMSPPTEPAHHAIWLPIDIAVEALGQDGDRAFLRRFL